MKYCIIALLPLLFFSFRSQQHFKYGLHLNDSVVINHVLDGSLSEWNMDQFQEEKKVGFKYAFDNDSLNLYIAIMVANAATQMKLIAQGMEVFFDTRGKKREEKGIGFPVNKTDGDFSPNEKVDMKQLRQRLALNMISLQLIKFENEPIEQELTKEGSANIRYSWDDANMYIEYQVPLSLLDDGSLDQKTLGIEFKIKAPQVKTVTRVVTTTVSQRAGSPPPSSNIPSSSINSPPSDQRFWTKYTVNIPGK